MTYEPPPDPHQPRQQPPIPPVPPAGWQYQQPYQGPPTQPHGFVTAKTGLTGGVHAIHAVLTFFTCGLWSPIWFLHWFLARRKTVTRY
jgi:hypothetical protein